MTYKTRLRPVWALFFALACIIVPSANANLIDTVATSPGTSVVPGLVSATIDPGTLLADESEFFSVAGVFSGTLTSAVFMESGGTLDFYYQIENDSTSADPIASETDANFTGFSTATGFLNDATVLEGVFVDGTISPVAANRDIGGDTVGFSFLPIGGLPGIAPGDTSNVLAISTNATTFENGTASIIYGGHRIMVDTYAPLQAVPEPVYVPLLGGALLALAAIWRASRSN